MIHLSRHLSSIYHNTQTHWVECITYTNDWSVTHDPSITTPVFNLSWIDALFFPWYKKKCQLFDMSAPWTFPLHTMNFMKKSWDMTVIYLGVCFFSETWREQEVWDVSIIDMCDTTQWLISLTYSIIRMNHMTHHITLLCSFIECMTLLSLSLSLSMCDMTQYFSLFAPLSSACLSLSLSLHLSRSLALSCSLSPSLYAWHDSISLTPLLLYRVHDFSLSLSLSLYMCDMTHYISLPCSLIKYQTLSLSLSLSLCRSLAQSLSRSFSLSTCDMTQCFSLPQVPDSLSLSLSISLAHTRALACALSLSSCVTLRNVSHSLDCRLSLSFFLSLHVWHDALHLSPCLSILSLTLSLSRARACSLYLPHTHSLSFSLSLSLSHTHTNT